MLWTKHLLETFITISQLSLSIVCSTPKFKLFLERQLYIVGGKLQQFLAEKTYCPFTWKLINTGNHGSVHKYAHQLHIWCLEQKYYFDCKTSFILDILAPQKLHLHVRWFCPRILKTWAAVGFWRRTRIRN